MKDYKHCISCLETILDRQLLSCLSNSLSLPQLWVSRCRYWESKVEPGDGGESNNQSRHLQFLIICNRFWWGTWNGCKVQYRQNFLATSILCERSFIGKFNWNYYRTNTSYLESLVLLQLADFLWLSVDFNPSELMSPIFCFRSRPSARSNKSALIKI